jgi:hypothetical protein
LFPFSDRAPPYIPIAARLSHPISATILARTSASSSEVTTPFFVAF